jgi:hypothetical protein
LGREIHFVNPIFDKYGIVEVIAKAKETLSHTTVLPIFLFCVLLVKQDTRGLPSLPIQTKFEQKILQKEIMCKKIIEDVDSTPSPRG